MTKNTKTGKRLLSKKVTSFNMYMDQANQIQAIMESSGIDKDAQVLRELLDEALSGRRRKVAEQLTLPDTAAPDSQYAETVETIQVLLAKLIEQGEMARSVRGICLELIQEALAESRASRKMMTSLAAVSGGCAAGIDEARQAAYRLASEVAKRLRHQTNLAAE